MVKERSRTNVIYFVTMTVILVCIVYNSYCLLHHGHNKSSFFVGINIVTSIAALLYLFIIIYPRKKLSKQRNEQIHKIFSKN